MKILQYRSPVQGSRVKHDFATNEENEAELLCRRFIRTWQRGPQDWHSLPWFWENVVFQMI